MIELNELLQKRGLDTKTVMVMRHCPRQPELRRMLPWLAEERPDIYNAYQSDHNEAVEGALPRAKWVVSCIGREPGKALFVGIFRVKAWRTITGAEWARREASKELIARGLQPPKRDHQLKLFDLEWTDHLADWKGRLVVKWPGLERSWWRWADRNDIRVDAVHAESILVKQMPKWHEMVLTFAELQSLPRLWQVAMEQWRGIYVIVDGGSGKSYVGSACGCENILGRWRCYAETGHGCNVDLKGRDPTKFKFAILQLVAQDLPPEDVIRLETNWKNRLGTREFGLNRN